MNIYVMIKQFLANVAIEVQNFQTIFNGFALVNASMSAAKWNILPPETHRYIYNLGGKNMFLLHIIPIY